MMMRLVVLISIFVLSDSFQFSHILARQRTCLFCEGTTAPKWPGDRPPIGNLLRVEQSMDATWGRGKFREEVWTGEVNPADDWWLAYTPSEEEQQAANAGYDFRNAKEWFQAKGIDYETARAETERLTQIRHEELKKKREEEERNFKFEDFMAMLDVAFRVGFRKRDNELQAAKGQPSLDNEDTGRQWLRSESSKVG